jgi:hypothetical protein
MSCNLRVIQVPTTGDLYSMAIPIKRSAGNPENLIPPAMPVDDDPPRGLETGPRLPAYMPFNEIKLNKKTSALLVR